MENVTKKHRILIIGGGSAGITVASMLLRQDKSLEIGLIEPSQAHYYQPAWTLVGAGAYDVEKTRQPMADVMPKGVHWIKDYAMTIDPDKQVVTTKGQNAYGYDYLVVAPGLQLDWGAIPGLAEGIGKNGLTSNYDYDHCQYTWKLIQEFKGGNALFTQPSTPIKCGGAPQKIMYLAEDYFRKHKIRDKANVMFYTPGSVIFGVKEFAKTLNKIIAERDIITKFKHKLVEIDIKNKKAVFELTMDASDCVSIEGKDDKTGEVVSGEGIATVPYDLMHLAPPQSAPDFIKESPIAHQEGPMKGWAKADKHSLRNPDYPNVYALGDVAGLPTAKTGAAIRKQAPIVVGELMADLQQKQYADAQYDGYSSCPLVTRYGKVVMAEFDYDNKPAPSVPLVDTTKEQTSMWMLKKHFIPWMYWNMMLKGRKV